MKAVFGFFISSLLLLLGCAQQELLTPNGGPLPPDPPIVAAYLALGDSYTIGQSVAETGRYPNQLADSLTRFNIELNKVDIVARTGWRTDELQAAITDRTDLAETYDLVSLLIGVNNQFQGKPIEVYEQEFRELLEQAIAFADGNKEHVFVVSIPDYAFTPYGRGRTDVSEGVDAFNAVNAAITEEFGIVYFNITPVSRRGLDEPDLVANDDLHPSAIQYAEWVSLLLEDIVEKLED